MADAETDDEGHESYRLSESAIGLIVFAVSLFYFNTTMHLTLELRDEGFLLYNIARVAHGEIPHRDFAEVYGPGFYLLTAPIFQIFGDRIMPMRELVAVVRAAAVAFAYLIARFLVPRSFALLAAFLSMVYWGRVIWNLTAPYATLFTITLCMLSLVFFMQGQKQNRSSSYFWSGFVCGGALLVKWSLAAVSAYGMVLAICAAAMLRDPPAGAPRSRVGLVLFIWLTMGVLIVFPFLSSVTGFDYLVHFAPIHGFVALVGVRFASAGDGRVALSHAFPRVLRYGAGFLILPICVALLYLWWGSLDDLFYNMVIRPLRRPNYYLSMTPPAAAKVAHLICLVLVIGAGVALLRGTRRVAAVFAALGCILAPFAYPALKASWNPSFVLQSVMLVQLAVTSFVVLCILAFGLSRTLPKGSESRFDALVAVLFFQEMMTFQIFPRATYNVIQMVGTMTPTIVWIAYRVYGLATAGDGEETPARRATAFALAAVLPLLLVGDIAYKTIVSVVTPEEAALHSPALAGIRPRINLLAPDQIRYFDELTQYLDTVEPLDAPVFCVPIENMIYFATGRDHLFEDHSLALFLAGWNFLRKEDRETPSEAEMIRRLEETPEAIVIIRRDDPTQARFVALFPGVSRYIDEHYSLEKEIGEYRVMRLDPAKLGRSGGASQTSSRGCLPRYNSATGSHERRSQETCLSTLHQI